MIALDKDVRTAPQSLQSYHHQSCDEFFYYFHQSISLGVEYIPGAVLAPGTQRKGTLVTSTQHYVYLFN